MCIERDPYIYIHVYIYIYTTYMHGYMCICVCIHNYTYTYADKCLFSLVRRWTRTGLARPRSDEERKEHRRFEEKGAGAKRADGTSVKMRRLLRLVA